MDAVDEDLDATSCNGSSSCHHGQQCNAHNLWSELNEVVDSLFKQCNHYQLVIKITVHISS
jgi:Rrf2 family iron-sulfur cluster assembly transcriptional regulator